MNRGYGFTSVSCATVEALYPCSLSLCWIVRELGRLVPSRRVACETPIRVSASQETIDHLTRFTVTVHPSVINTLAVLWTRLYKNTL